MGAPVICHPFLHQHAKQGLNEDECLFEGRERLHRAGKPCPKGGWEGVCSDPPFPSPSWHLWATHSSTDQCVVLGAGWGSKSVAFQL